MRIGIDYRPVLRPNSRRRGIGKFTASQIEHVLHRGGHDFVLYTIGNQKPGLSERVTWRQLPQIRRPSRLNWLLDRFRLHKWIDSDGLDLYYATEVTAVPKRCSCPLVVTVHDVIPLVYWAQIKTRIPIDYRIGLKHAYRRAGMADRIITISESARQDICSHLGIEEEKVEVVYPGCNPLFRPLEPEAARQRLRSKHGIEGSFLFYVGGSDYRKNLDFLITGFAQIREQGYAGSLVLAGETFRTEIPEVQELKRKIRELDLANWVLCPGYVEDNDLPAFYCASDLFVFPSLYEGFGLPVLEALACGAPVLASDRSSIPEVGGGVVAYFDPERLEDLVARVLDLLENPGRLRQMRAAGPERAAQFSWEENARAVTSIYESLK